MDPVKHTAEDLALIRREVLALVPEAPVEQAADLLVRVQVARDRLRELGKLCEERIMEWIDANGPIQIGEIRYVIGAKKSEKCLDLRATLEAVVDQAEGRVEVLLEALSSNAFKPATTRKIIGQTLYDQLFETRIERDLNEKPVRELKRIDPRYARQELR